MGGEAVGRREIKGRESVKWRVCGGNCLTTRRRKDVDQRQHIGMAEMTQHLDLAEQPLAIGVHLERARDLLDRHALSAFHVAAGAHQSISPL